MKRRKVSDQKHEVVAVELLASDDSSSQYVSPVQYDLLMDLIPMETFLLICCIAVSMGHLDSITRLKITSKKYYDVLNDDAVKKTLFDHCDANFSIFKNSNWIKSYFAAEGFAAQWHTQMFFDYPDGITGIIITHKNSDGDVFYYRMSEFIFHLNTKKDCACEEPYNKLAEECTILPFGGDRDFYTRERDDILNDLDNMISKGARFYNVVNTCLTHIKPSTEITEIEDVDDLNHKLTDDTYWFRIQDTNTLMPLMPISHPNSSGNCYSGTGVYRRKDCRFIDKSAGLHPLFYKKNRYFISM